MGWQPFGSVHGLLRCNINTGVHPRMRGADVSLRDVTVAPMENGDGECEWRHAPEARVGISGILKKVSWVESCLGRRRLTFTCSRRPWSGVARDGGAKKKKSLNRKNVYLSPYFEEPLNSKVIKSFVPERRSRKCFSYFKIPMFYVYVNEHSMSISRISVYVYDTDLLRSDRDQYPSVMYEPTYPPGMH